jgi:predicted HTH domain antitoxin
MGETDKTIWTKFEHLYKAHTGKVIKSKKAEIFPLAEPDFREDRLDLLVRQALDKELISVSRAAEILGISLLDMRERIRSWSVVA